MALEGKTVFTDSKDFTLTTIKDMFDDGEYLSSELGQLGGHTSFTGKADDNIYGQLDCG